MDYCYENAAHEIIRVTDGDVIRFIPVDAHNSEFQLLSAGSSHVDGQSNSVTPPSVIIDPFLE